MAQPNAIFENPRTGDKVHFLVTAAQSDGERLKVQIWSQPGVAMPPEHFHPLQTETMEIIQGKMGLLLNSQEQQLTAGDKITIPKGNPHKTWNAGDSELVLTSELRPALKSEQFIETLFALGAQGQTDGQGVPKSFLQFATLLNENYGEMFVTSPPVPIQKFTAKVIGRLGKLLGYKGYIPFTPPT